MDPKWHEALDYANIEIFEMSYEESFFNFQALENLDNIRRTNGPVLATLLVDKMSILICYR
jgi:hypothetical protein